MVRTIPFVSNGLVLRQMVLDDFQFVNHVVGKGNAVDIFVKNVKTAHRVNLLRKGFESVFGDYASTQRTRVMALFPLVDTMDMKGVAAREPSYIHRMFLVVQANGTRFHGLETCFLIHLFLK